MIPSDEQLLIDFTSGPSAREAAFQELVRRHGAGVKGFAYRLLHSRDEAEEVYAETFLRVAQSAARWEPRGTVRAWIFTIARRLSYDVLRHRTVVRRGESSVVELERWRGAVPSPEARAQLGQVADRLERALAQLPEEHREVVLLRTVHGLDARETAQAMGVTEDQVNSRLSYARRRLRDILEGSPRLLVEGA
jgi:RNA polymerase sigma factor (sigma-70 family)